MSGATVADRREQAPEHKEIEAIRRLLCHEPRGHADMYGCFQVPPNDSGAHFGVLFWHKDGYSTACGHGTIALGAWAVHSGLVDADPEGESDVVVDVPSGESSHGFAAKAVPCARWRFATFASYVLAESVPVTTTKGATEVALVYGGAIYATVAASDFGLSVVAEDVADLIRLAREIRQQIDGAGLASHPDDARLSGLYGTIFYDDLGRNGGSLRQRNVTVFGDGEVDRSPCGSGTAGRLAELVADGDVGIGDELIHKSIVGTTFRARAVERLVVHGRSAIVPEVEGMAYRTGEHRFELDPEDPLGTGFVLR